MTITAVTLYSTGITFLDGFNSTNTTTITNGSAAAGSTLVLGSANGSTANTAAAWSITDNASSGTVTFADGASKPLTLSLFGSGTISVSSSATVVISSLIQDFGSGRTGGITKDGTGTLTLSRVNTYSGGTTVSNGTLSITNTAGSATGSGAVTVNSSGTLAGTGFINAGSNTITINGTVSPGVNGAGTIHLASSNAGAGALTLSATSTLAFDITNTTTKDLIALTSTKLTLGSGTLALNLPNTGPTGIDYTATYAIFTGVSSLTGSFGSVTGYDTTDNVAQFALNGTEYDLTFKPVPEPGTWCAAALALGVIGYSQRRRFTRLLKRA
jgi:autotransporter-associated beta strand protein